MQTGECTVTHPEFECECEDWDKECWKFCLVSTVTNAKLYGMAEQNVISSLLPKIWGTLKKIFGFEFATDYLTDYALENPEFEGNPECECEDGDDECLIYCLESTITNENLDGMETAQFFRLIPKILSILKKIFRGIFRGGKKIFKKRPRIIPIPLPPIPLPPQNFTGFF